MKVLDNANGFVSKLCYMGIPGHILVNENSKDFKIVADLEVGFFFHLHSM